MADNEYGPFDSEADVRATRAAAALRAARDANPGAWKEENLRVMTEACEEAGIELGDFDLAPFRQLAMYEPFNAVVTAAVIHRAFEAGKASALKGTVTQYGFRYESVDGVTVSVPEPGDDMRQVLSELEDLGPGARRTVVTRQVTPWKEVPGA